MCIYTKCEYVSLEMETTAGQSIALEKQMKIVGLGNVLNEIAYLFRCIKFFPSIRVNDDNKTEGSMFWRVD